jgi:hypothetical protein
MILSDLTIDQTEFETRTGWEIKPEGACKGDECVLLPPDLHVDAHPDGRRLDARVLSERLGMPLLADDDAGVWALGPATQGTGRVLTTAKAPELTLPDADGNPFRLSSLLGKKVLLVAWASW